MNADLEAAVKMVLAAGLSTGHADHFQDLMGEVLGQYDELKQQILCDIIDMIMFGDIHEHSGDTPPEYDFWDDEQQTRFDIAKTLEEKYDIAVL